MPKFGDLQFTLCFKVSCNFLSLSLFSGYICECFCLPHLVLEVIAFIRNGGYLCSIIQGILIIIAIILILSGLASSFLALLYLF